METKEFIEKFSSKIPSYEIVSSNPSLRNNPIYISLCNEMLLSLPIKPSEKIINQMVQSIDTLYDNCAVNVLYNTILFYLENGYWLMGMDKCQIILGDNGTSIKLDSNKYFAYQTEKLILGCSTYENEPNWHYSLVMVKGLENLFEFVEKFHEKIDFDEHFGSDDLFEFDGVQFDFEDIEFIGSGFSSLKPENVINALKK